MNLIKKLLLNSKFTLRKITGCNREFNKVRYLKKCNRCRKYGKNNKNFHRLYVSDSQYKCGRYHNELKTYFRNRNVIDLEKGGMKEDFDQSKA